MTKQNNPELLHNLVVLLREKNPEDSKYVPSVGEQSGSPIRKSIISGFHAVQREEDQATGKNDEEERPIVFLLTQLGKELLIHDNLHVQKKKKKFISKSHLVIHRDANYVSVCNKNNLLYAVALLCEERTAKGQEKTEERATLTGRNNYTRVLSTLEDASHKFEANLNYYVTLAKGECHLRKIHLMDCSQMVWDFQFFKQDLKRRIKYAQRSKHLCFVLSPGVLVREYALFVSGLMRRLGRGSRGALFHVVDDSAVGQAVTSSAGGEVVTNSAIDEAVDASHLAPRHPVARQQKTPFLEQIWFILSLLKEENTNLRNIYHLEHYTKIFLHNCDKLNRKSFISFLKQINHLHVHAVNLNTLFGLYFSETEENILKVFRKCERVSKQTGRSVCLVMDGIDVVARRRGEGPHGERDGDHDGGRHDDGDGPGGAEPNDNGRLLTTLLLCLDSIDNYTGRRRPPRRAAVQRGLHDEGNTGHNTPCKGDNPARRVQKKKHSPEVDLYEEDSDHMGRSSTDQDTKKKLKRKKLATHVTCDIKQLAKIYKEKHSQLMRRKKKKNISIIVLSDLDLKHYDISLTRAGRFFHFIKYA
ncbi:hypothetical protein AK88_00622 [Plasmodium fragile]|uniref:ATPase AAA-type core domain-containing protein n=1 Tax=Plasmodium fragile TaxID=5857 RepID=A0A0D9QRI7_PLAFR|nr:uncharacterized protein AK88_00622 [Plasmodium fragile]KJP89664.1 hypothetical protein AK88_00622 [Plasmodium fragile]